MEVLLSKSDRDKAIQSAILLLQLTRQLDRHRPTLTEFMVSIAMKHLALKDINRALQAGPVSDQTRKALAAELPLHDSMEKLQKTLKFERAYGLDCIQREFPGLWIVSNKWQLKLLDVFDDFNKISLLPSADRATQEYRTLKTNLSSLDFPLQLMLPSFQHSMMVAYRSRAMVRAVRIINALQEKPPLDSNKIPTMAELGLPDEVGVDPFNGKPMIIKKLPKAGLSIRWAKTSKTMAGKF